MQESLYQKADAVDSLSDGGCKRTLHQSTDAGSHLYQTAGCWRLYQTADAGDSLSDSGCRRLSIRQRIQETLSESGCSRLYPTADAEDSPSDNMMQESLYQTADAGDSIQTADAGDSLSDSGCRRLSIRQRIQETLYQTADAGDSIR